MFSSAIILNLGHSFKVQRVIPAIISFTKLGRYAFILGEQNLTRFGFFLQELLKTRPTFKFKDIGLRLLLKKPLIKKFSKDVNRNKKRTDRLKVHTAAKSKKGKGKK